MSSVTFSNQNFFFLSFSFLRLPFLFFLFVFFHYKNLVLEDCFAKFCLTLCHVKFFNLLFYVNEDENIMLVSDDGMSHLNTLNFVDICRRLLIQRNKIIFFFLHGATAHSGPRPPHYRGFTITLRHTTLGRTPLDQWSARRRDNNTQYSQETDIHAPGGVRTRSPSKRKTADPRLGPHGHWVTGNNINTTPYITSCTIDVDKHAQT